MSFGGGFGGFGQNNNTNAQPSGFGGFGATNNNTTPGKQPFSNHRDGRWQRC
jgi:nuclear pore complex protein Nup98-Nup96